MKLSLKLIFPLLGLLFLGSCSTNNSSSLAHDGHNSIYYWRTTFTLNDAERKFLKNHDITKIYVRFFDVDNYMVVPEATIRFDDSIPNGIEIVPTVYITTLAMDRMQLKEDEYAEKIFKRVNAICRRNGIEFNELQLDCDWTKRTGKYFFKLCEEMKLCLDSTQTLSSTIRLHQLTQAPPPVDKGVLMVYNTGNLMDMTTDNSIFSKKDIQPYLRDNRLADYSLPMDVAYPAYGWSLIFNHRGDKYYFDRITRCTDFSAYPELKKIDRNLYEATEWVDRGEYIHKGDIVRTERPAAQEILEIKDMIENQLKNKPHNNILYHLDESQLSHYSDNEISKIYTRN